MCADTYISESFLSICINIVDFIFFVISDYISAEFHTRINEPTLHATPQPQHLCEEPTCAEMRGKYAHS